MKIKLSDEQIAMLVKNETDRIQKKFVGDKLKLEKKHEAEIKDLINKLESDLSKLTNKFQYIEVAEPTPLKPKAKIDATELTQMVADKKSVKEMAEYFGASESSIRSKLWKLNITLSEKTGPIA